MYHIENGPKDDKTTNVQRRKQAEGTLNKAAFAGLELLQALSPSPFLQSRWNGGCQRGPVHTGLSNFLPLYKQTLYIFQQQKIIFKPNFFNLPTDWHNLEKINYLMNAFWLKKIY